LAGKFLGKGRRSQQSALHQQGHKSSDKPPRIGQGVSPAVRSDNLEASLGCNFRERVTSRNRFYPTSRPGYPGMLLQRARSPENPVALFTNSHPYTGIELSRCAPPPLVSARGTAIAGSSPIPYEFLLVSFSFATL